MGRKVDLRRAWVAAGAALVVGAALLAGLAVSVAGRGDYRPARVAEGGSEWKVMGDPVFSPDSSVSYWRRTKRPHGRERAAGLSPFGAEAWEVGWERPGRGETGRAARSPWDEAGQARMRSLPEGLKAGVALELPEGRGGLGGGTSLVQVKAGAYAELGPEGVERALGRYGRVVGMVPERTYVVRSFGMESARGLARERMVERAMPYHPGLKVDPMVGRTPLIQASRAASPRLELLVAGWPGADAEERRELREAVGKLVGTGSVEEYEGDGGVLRVEADATLVAGIAGVEAVAAVQEAPEYFLYNSEAPSVVLVGSYEDTQGARPYHDIGVDGGGIDTNGDGQRLNDGSDTVPPQIVAVTDNGISLDTPGFSQTATAVAPFPNVVGGSHRKVHAIQAVADTGNGCDGVLFGSGTHGHVVASAIAAWPSALGVYASKTITIRRPVVSGIPMDGVARGARILMQDAAAANRCAIDELVELGGNVTPGNLAVRLQTARDGGAEVHLHTLPFGVPNFDNVLDNPQNGTYSIEANQIDTFLMNNRDYMVFMPVGSQGVNPNNLTQRRYPDLFDGTALDNDANAPAGPQIPPPATAKNIVSVGAHRTDMQTLFGTFNQEEVPSPWASSGPATPGSLRMAPIVTSVGEDFSSIFAAPGTGGVAVFRSRDNDNLAPVEAELDELNFGTSFAAAYATGAGAVVRDYFAQGYYPAGSRRAADRMPQVSGALVKAALVASANFLEEGGIAGFPSPPDKVVAQARSVNLGSVAGATVGVLGNNLQGYGRVQVSNVLPISNWPPGRGVGAPDTLEYPVAGLVVYDDMGTREAPIDNGANGVVARTFAVNGSETVLASGGGRAVAIGALRVALAWVDPPSLTLSAGALINDLDLEVESPGPDNCLSAADTRPDGSACAANAAVDNVTYDGNVYVAGQGPRLGQWSQGRQAGSPDVADDKNPVEAVHLTADVNGDGNAVDSQLMVGRWRVRAKRGLAGAVAGQISMIHGTPEDTNGNFRLEPGEDLDSDGLLDAGGQPYALVIAGPVLGEGTQTWGGQAHAFPGSRVHLDKAAYGCSDALEVQVYDPDGTVAGLESGTVLTVQNAAGAVLDEERGFAFSEAPVGSRGFRSARVPVRLVAPSPVANNGLLEADTGQFIVVDYPDTPVAGQARAIVNCDPGLFAGVLNLFGGSDAAAVLSGGCDRDQHLDAGEIVAYTVAVVNSNRQDDFTGVTARLTPSGPGAAAVRVLDSPKGIGRLPGGQTTGVGFSLLVDGAVVAGLPVVDRKVTLTLTLDSTARSKELQRQSFSFTHALNSDDEVFHYSTDFPTGGREVRDLNRNLLIDPADRLNPVTHIQTTDEDVTFSTLYLSDGGVVWNTVGEDTNRNGVLDGGEDIIPNGVLDKGILASAAGPAAADFVPFTFDRNRGGFTAIRNANSEPGSAGLLVLWEYQTLGVCGMQTAIADSDPFEQFNNAGAGMWHTGDGNVFTPNPDPKDPFEPPTPACEDYRMPSDLATPQQVETLLDVVQSPILSPVHRAPDARGFPYTVEFQRLAMNLNHQTYDAYAGGFIDLDSDIDTDNTNCLLCQIFYPRFGGVYYQVARLNTYVYGVNPFSLGETPQRTFGPLTDPDNSVAVQGKVRGDESGFTGFTTNTNINSSSPIPTAPPDLLPHPLPGTTLPLAADGTPLSQRRAGPTRNFDLNMVEYQDGLIYMQTGPGAFEAGGVFKPGPAGTRWQFGIGFFVIESVSGKTDYGMGMDDPVLEWDEIHPLDEGQFSPPRPPACQRFGGAGQPAGQPCATLVVDRTHLYECDEAIGVTVHDPRRAGAGTVQVQAASESDGTLVSTGLTNLSVPLKSFPLQETAPGLFRGTITVTSQFHNPGTLFVTPSSDQTVAVYYVDPECDGDRDGAAGETAFDNADGDGLPAATDKCPFVFDPAQPDQDADGIGDLCDNCPARANAGQADADEDGVGNTCDLDDIDFDAVENVLDNCPDVYNELQAPGAGGLGVACDGLGDRDGDGVADRNDNCVRTANPSQADADGDGIGDACDGDCLNARASNSLANFPNGACTRSSTIICSTDPQCPISGRCSVSRGLVCLAHADCPPTERCRNIAQELCERRGVINDGSCSTTDDDVDRDGVPDVIDSCPTFSNPVVIPGTTHQADADLDGLGDACDPGGTLDDDRNGVPDDLLSNLTVVACRALPLARLVVQRVEVGDVFGLGGDLDTFPDSGETARIYVTVKNTGTLSLTNVNLNLNSTDPDIACITAPSVARGQFLAGETLVLGSIGPDRIAGTADDTGDYFEVVTRPALQTLIGSAPAFLDLVLTLTSSAVQGTASEVAVRLPADLDLPTGAMQVKVAGPDGLPGTADDGLVVEDFDTERDGTTGISLADQPLGTPGVRNDTIGVWVGSAFGGSERLRGIGCGGFNVPPADPGCVIDPDNDMGWHIHCPAGTCPNGALFVTPTGGALARSGLNSLHWGHHLDPNSRNGDTTRFRQLAAFLTNPINLAVLPDPGDLQLSFFHIAGMVTIDELNRFGRRAPSHGPPTGARPLGGEEAFDFGDVQIQVDANPDPLVDEWGFWDKLVPFENVYDHIPQVWSRFGTGLTYCILTPRDTGNAPPAPRKVHETMCWPQGVWSSCGWAYDRTTTRGCPGPGFGGSQGNGNWVQTKFDLSNFLGQRVRIRWIAQSWEFNNAASSYQELGGTWADLQTDDGWWVDDIVLSGAIEEPITPDPDVKTPAPGSCPTACDAGVGDGGTAASLVLVEANGNGVVERAEQVTLDASASGLPGGCVGGVAQYRFLRDGAVVQDWSTANTFVDAPLKDATYRLVLRCSADFTCASVTGATLQAQVYTGDGEDLLLMVRHATPATTAEIEWTARPQLSSVDGYDVFQGTIVDMASEPNLATLGCLQADVAQAAVGATRTALAPAIPPVGQVHYYLVGHSGRAAGAKDALGRRTGGTIRVSPVACP